MRKLSLLIFASCLCAQTFDAASVKLVSPPGFGMKIPPPSGGPGTKDPGRIHYSFMPLARLITIAYDVKSYQKSEPAWLLTAKERFDITATMPPGTTNEQFHLMLQNLLAERFKLKIHRETRELPIYSLVVARNGPKMKESAVAAAPKDGGEPAQLPPPPVQSKMGPDGFPVLHPRAPGSPIATIMMTDRRGSRARMVAQGNTVQDLADRLTGLTKRPVIDATALKAKYDFTLIFKPGGMNGPVGPTAAAATPDADALPDIFSALQAQLGLKLETKKAPIKMIVIDHIEKTPTEN
jgi:uncharacterized protein (TIGR03435 family)